MRAKPTSLEHGQCGANSAHSLRDPLLVLDEGEADVTVPTGAEAGSRADRDLGFAQQFECELVRAELAVARRDRRPHEHRPERLRHLPADAREAVAECVAAAAIQPADLR